MPTVNVATFLKALESAPKDTDANIHTNPNKESASENCFAPVAWSWPPHQHESTRSAPFCTFEMTRRSS